MKTSTDASIFHMAFDLELHVDTNKNKDYFLHGTTCKVLAPSDCFYYHNICRFRVVNNAPTQIQRHLALSSCEVIQHTSWMNISVIDHLSMPKVQYNYLDLLKSNQIKIHVLE